MIKIISLIIFGTGMVAFLASGVFGRLLGGMSTIFTSFATEISGEVDGTVIFFLVGLAAVVIVGVVSAWKQG